jgi:RNA-splicing ligase RtcB
MRTRLHARDHAVAVAAGAAMLPGSLGLPREKIFGSTCHVAGRVQSRTAANGLSRKVARLRPLAVIKG